MSNIVVISLKRATERREAMKKEVERVSLENVIFLDAVDGKDLPDESIPNISLPGGWRYGEKFKPGEVGCTLSHVNALKMAKENEWDHVIILEDDITIAEDFNKRIKLLLRIVPRDWEHIYLSGTPHLPYPPVNPFPHLIPSPRTDCTHSYILNSPAYDKVIEKLESLATTTDDLYNHMILAEGRLKSYSFFPYVTHANSSYSYIWNKSAGHNIKNESKNYFKDKI